MTHIEINRSMTDNQARTISLMEVAPDIFYPGLRKSILYIGAQSDNFLFSDKIKAAYPDITILEMTDRTFSGVATINCKIEDYIFDRDYDTIMWWAGPEHVHREDLDACIAKIEAHGKLIAFMVPWGLSQGDPTHYITYYAGEWEDKSYRCVYSGKVDCCELDKASAIVMSKGA